MLFFLDKAEIVRFVREIRKSGHHLPDCSTVNHMEQVHASDADSIIMIDNTEKEIADDHQTIDCVEEDDVYDRTYPNKEYSKGTSHGLCEMNQNIKEDVIDLSTDRLEDDDDDDLVVVASNDDTQENIGRRALRRIVQSE